MILLECCDNLFSFINLGCDCIKGFEKDMGNISSVSEQPIMIIDLNVVPIGEVGMVEKP